MKIRPYLPLIPLLIFQTGIASGAQIRPLRRQLTPLSRLSSSFQYLARRVSPSVVQIVTRGYEPVKGEDSGTVATARGTGSGIILDSDGYIVTNGHVVEGAQRVQVLLAEESGDNEEGALARPRGRMIPATVVGIDTDTDLAVIKVDMKELPFLELADSSKLRQGQVVLACGSPLGLENTVSMGVISSVSRQIKPEDTMVYIQTDAPINPGNSGGALVDTDGKVVGINTFILTQSGGSEGLGFAIPSNVVRNIYKQLRKDGHAHRGFIGVMPRTITPTLAEGLRLPKDWGVILEDVAPDTPAAEAGLQPGDLVLSFNGRPVADARRFEISIFQRSIGDTVNLEILRGSEKIEAKVTVAERPNDPNRFADLVTRESNLVPQLGILVLNLSEQVSAMLPPLRKPAGVLVAARVAEAPGLGEDFSTGDLISEINGTPILNADGLRSALDKIHSGDPVVAQIQRQGRLTFVVFEMP